MAEARKYAANQQLSLDQILQDAKQRWLRPVEIIEILQNYQKFSIRDTQPKQPSGGSLLLFNRKVLRNFRKDGHLWKKKKDGKTVKEAHEKLKVGSVDVLQCYYAHGETNANFQRRIYWMLDEQFENIVLVHYREVKEGHRSGSHNLLVEPGSLIGRPHITAASPFALGNSPAPAINTPSTSRTDWKVQALSSEFEEVDSRDHQTASPPAQPICFPETAKDAPGYLCLEPKYHDSGSSLWPNIKDSIGRTYAVDDSKHNVGQPHVADFNTDMLSDIRLPAIPDVVTGGNRFNIDVDTQTITVSSDKATQAPQEHDFKLINSLLQNDYSPNMIVSCFLQDGNQSNDSSAFIDQSVELKKFDSFGRWMDKEYGGDCGDSLMASDSGHYWNTLDAGTDDKEVSSLSRHMQLDMDSLGPSLSWEQLFSIHDFSPDWAYSGVETKVLIVGEFLGNKMPSSSTKWGCMFGEIEVSAEVLTNNVIRCQTPPHSPGRVPFHITCNNRLACSEVREFVFLEKPSGIPSVAVKSTPEEEVSFQIRLAKLLIICSNRKWLDCSTQECDKCKLKDTIYSMKTFGRWDCKDDLNQNMLRYTLCDWLLCKLHEHSKALHVLDEEGQGVIHLVAALGYDWALGPMVAAGFNPNFRDIRGRTALHWASQFGREKTVLTLIKLGVAPGAVDDPTTEFLGGRTAADLASSRGHRGIAGYLAEADLTTHLSSLTGNNSEIDNVVAITTEEDVGDQPVDDHCSLRGSLSAIRKSENAAALIQAAFRARSFKDRQLTRISSESNDVFEVSLDAGALSSLNKVQKASNLHASAVKIQKKYRGWKRRNDFLQKRNNIIKIQAHIRGHQVRKQYKKILWSVGIVEKAILRWRRKGAGLRGFRAKSCAENPEAESETSDEYEFLRIGRKQKIAGVEKALARVKSMAGDPEGRDQYMRLVKKVEELEVATDHHL